jgi:hypothetical protein
MSTVSRLLYSRSGGLSSLGLDGFLARLLSFIDVNSAFLLGTTPYLGEYHSVALIPMHRPFQPLEGYNTVHFGNASGSRAVIGHLAAESEQLSVAQAEASLDARISSLEKFIGLMNRNT